MTNEKKLCAAQTKAGTPCKNSARPNSDYCHLHQPAPNTLPPATPSNLPREQLEQLMTELNQLAADLQKMVDNYTPPPFTPQGMIALLKENLHRFTPEMRLQIVEDLQKSFEGASTKDFLQPETWKGMWFLLNYSLQNQTESARNMVWERLQTLPGVSTLNDLQGMFQGATPKDLLNVETWKGVWFLLNYSLQNQAQQVKKRLLGETES